MPPKRRFILSLAAVALIALLVLGAIIYAANSGGVGWLGLPKTLWYILSVWAAAIVVVLFLSKKTRS